VRALIAGLTAQQAGPGLLFPIVGSLRMLETKIDTGVARPNPDKRSRDETAGGGRRDIQRALSTDGCKGNILSRSWDLSAEDGQGSITNTTDLNKMIIQKECSLVPRKTLTDANVVECWYKQKAVQETIGGILQGANEAAI